MTMSVEHEGISVEMPTVCLSVSTSYIVNKFQHVWWGVGGGCSVRSNLNTFDHVKGTGPCPGGEGLQSPI